MDPMPVYDQRLFHPPAPVALVTLKSPVSDLIAADVLMLLDSGADATMVPERVVANLGIETVGTTQYEFIGIEGTGTVAVAVALERRFLRITFRGQFLVIRQDYGILGRNVLNNVPLLLNGPRLTWDEALGR